MKTKRLEENEQELAAEILSSGGMIAMPTETVYGLFAKAFDERAVRELFSLKKRELDHSLNLNISSIDDIYKYSKNQPENLDEIVAKFLPGPLTIILQANDQVPAYINEGKTTVGFRMPDNDFTLNVIKKTGVLVGPSANITGQASPRKISEVLTSFEGKIAAVKADDENISGIDSTIIDLSADAPKILRQGSVKLEDMEGLL